MEREIGVYSYVVNSLKSGDALWHHIAEGEPSNSVFDAI